MPSPINILSTKKLNSEQLNHLQEVGTVTHLDIIETSSAFDFIVPEYSHIIFSSFKGCQYGLKALGDAAKNYSYSCVGEKSKELLTKQNLKIDHYSNYSKELTHKLLKTKSYSYLTGSKRLNTIPNFLLKNKITFEEIISYKSEISTQIPKGKQDYIMWFSPGGIKAYYNQNKPNSNTQHFCIGKTTKEALLKRLPDLPLNQIKALNKPSTDDLIQLICNKNNIEK